MRRALVTVTVILGLGLAVGTVMTLEAVGAKDGALFRGRAVAAGAQPDQPVSPIGLLPQPQPVWIIRIPF